MKNQTALLAVAAGTMMMHACDRPTILIERAPAHLYSSAADCQWSLRVGPGDSNNRTPVGVIAIIPPGTRVRMKSEDLGKEARCYDVQYGRLSGYVVGAACRVHPVDEPCQ